MVPHPIHSEGRLNLRQQKKGDDNVLYINDSEWKIQIQYKVLYYGDFWFILISTQKYFYSKRIFAMSKSQFVVIEIIRGYSCYLHPYN